MKNNLPRKNTGDLLSDCCHTDFDAFGFPKDDGLWHCLKCGKPCEPVWTNYELGTYNVLKKDKVTSEVKMEPPEEDWEKEFDEEFGGMMLKGHWASELRDTNGFEQIKSFISHLLKQREQKVAKKIGQAMVAGGLNIKELTDPKEYASQLAKAKKETAEKTKEWSLRNCSSTIQDGSFVVLYDLLTFLEKYL